MPIEVPNTPPYSINTGNADILLTQADFLRNNPYYLTTFFNTYGGYTTFTTKLRALGFVRSVAVQTPISEHYFEDRETRTFTVGSVVTPSTGAGTNIVIALAAADMKTIVGDDGVSRNWSRPRETEVVQFPDLNNYKIISKNKNVNPHQLTLRPISTTVDPATAVVEDAKAFIISPTGAEATGQPGPVTNVYGKYANRFAIAKETALTSGTAMTSKSPLAQIDGMPGYWYVKDVQDATVRHEMNKNKLLIHGQIGTNVTQYSPDFDENFTDRNTEGFIQHALAVGEEINYPTLAAYDIENFNDIAAHYRRLAVSTRNLAVWQGADIQARVEDVLIDFLADKSFETYISNNYMKNALKYFWDEGITQDDAFVHLGFRGIKKQGFNFLFSSLNELNDIEGGGADGFDYPTWQFFIPIGLTKDAKSKKSLPYFQFEHRGQAAGGYQREDEVWKTGGAGPIQKTDEFDVQRSYFRSEILLHIANGSLIVTQREDATASS